jgi:hypothetical protein
MQRLPDRQAMSPRQSAMILLHHIALAYCLSTIFSENRHARIKSRAGFLRIML